MTIKTALQQYVDKKVTALELIGGMTAMFKPEAAVDLLALINQITRLEAGRLDMETFKSIYKLE